ncbi:PREDICTED: translocase of chloroplast 159, chloroplastic-like isoform X2 [Tarenaya hassleriana]|nr:PREDICTED: translocase of chloroplast 159, chloroplastic-like isoform X2 [Tarenaya hassleriana]
MEDPDAESGEISGFAGRSIVYTPFVVSVNYSSFGEEKSESSNEVDGVSESEIGSEAKAASLNAGIAIPRVRLSLDDDDEIDETLSSEDEDNQLRVVKPPGYSGEVAEVMDELNCSGSVTGEFIIFTEEEKMMGMNYLDNGGDATEESDELLVENKGNFVEAGKGIDETVNQVIEQVAIQGTVIEETDHIPLSGAPESNALMIAVEGSIGLGSGDSESEKAGNMVGEGKDCRENVCGVVSGLGRQEYEVEPEESEKDRKQDLEEIGRKLSPFEESFRSSPHINNQVALESDSEVNQISVKVEESSLLSDKDDEVITSANYSVITDEDMENETQIEQLIHDQTLEEFEETNGGKEKPFHSTLLSVPEEPYPEHFTWKIRKEEKERIKNMQILKTKLMRIVRRLGLSADDLVVTEVLYELTQASGEYRTSRGFYSEYDVMLKTIKLETEGPEDLDFSINILVLGKIGVGKSATINSIFSETKSPVGSFGLTTKSVKYIVGKVGGVQVRAIDTPGLRSSATEEWVNREVLLSVKRCLRTFPVDIVLFVDRLDGHSGNTRDIQLLRTVTSYLGPSIWRNSIFILTHAATTVLDSPNYKDFVTQRSFLLCQSLRQAVPELASIDVSMIPRVVLAENEKLFQETKTDEFKSLMWRSQLLLLCCSAKIMAETSYLQKDETLVEKPDLFAPPLRSFTIFFSLWNMLLHGADPRQVFSCLHHDFEGKIGHFLDSETFLMNKRPVDEGINKGFEVRTALDRVRTRNTRKRRLEFQVKPGSLVFGFISVSDQKTGLFSVGTNEEREGRMLVKMRGSMAVLGVVPLLMSVFSFVYVGK